MKHELSLTHRQYEALSAIYGPPSAVHSMLMTSEFEGKRVILEGSEADFEELIEVILQEIQEGLCTATNQKALLQICRKVDPSSADLALF